MISIAQTARAEDSCSEPVRTGSGLVRGASESKTSTCVWRGIPYAAAPVGELRWKAPQPAPAWSGVRDTVAFGNRCMQKGILFNSKGPKAMSEDCLFLNIWRPSPAKRGGKYPVMVWIHGGGYITGGGDEDTYHGGRLANAGDVVVVSINYRLDVFGFLASHALREEDPNHSTGGYGTLDQAFALKWVHDNIANFGGDPANVTIFGESAGGWSTCTLVATPLTKGLFNRAIMESGTCEASRTPEAAYEVGKKSFLAVGCRPDDITCMRKLSASTILYKGSGSIVGGFDYVPVQDGYVLKDTPLEMIRSGDFNRVGVMAGTNLDEFAGATKLVAKYYYTLPPNYKRNMTGAFGTSRADASTLAALYPLSEFKNRPVLAYGRMFAADACLLCPTRRAAVSLAGQGIVTWLYRFDYHDTNFGQTAGAFHSAEVPFVFGNLDAGTAKSLIPKSKLEPAAALSKTMMGYWANFAKTGDPNGPGLPTWSVFNAKNSAVQILDKQVRNEPFSAAARCDFWDAHLPYMELVDDLVASLPTYKCARLAPPRKF
jgi:para-nitrobenzyl esterase